MTVAEQLSLWKLIPPAGATRTRGAHLKGASLDLECVPLDQGQSYLAASLGDDALKGGAGNAHALGRLGLGQALQVGEAQGFHLLVEQRDAA